MPKVVKYKRNLRATITFRLPKYVISSLRKRVKRRGGSRYIESLIVKDLGLEGYANVVQNRKWTKPSVVFDNCEQVGEMHE